LQRSQATDAVDSIHKRALDDIIYTINFNFVIPAAAISFVVGLMGFSVCLHPHDILYSPDD
jgi:hypothetical protein